LRIEHGTLRRVDRLGCHGCTSRPKRERIELLQREFPASEPDSTATTNLREDAAGQVDA